ncbi:MAG: enoyl-CoA hydratase/isomerase family protein [Acidimicrobiales bacterium]
MALIDISQHGDVRVLHWADGGDNRFNRASVAAWHEALDELDAVDGPLAVVAVGDGKFFSNGLDLDRFAADEDEAGPTVDGLHRLFGRLLLFGAYTVCAVNGHAFAGGAMLTCGFDARVMRSGRGYWCVPEVDLGLPFTVPMYEVVAARLPSTATQEAMLTGRRYTAEEALAAGIVDEVAPEDEVLERAIARAQAVATKDRSVIARHKQLLFGDAAAACGWPPA